MAESMENAAAPRLRVFISYSRRDGLAAAALRDALIQEGFDAFLDIHDIAPGEPWTERLGALIASAEKIIFLVSPDSVASEICAWEVEEAERQGKSVLPLVVRETEISAVPGRLARLNFLPFRTEAERVDNLPRIYEALSTNLAWERERTRLNDLALGWEASGRARRALLSRDDAVRSAERWRDGRPPSSPPPTPLQLAFVAESRAALMRRQRRAFSGAVLVAVVTAGLAIAAAIQRAEAVSQREIADASAAEAQRSAEAAEQSRRRTEEALDGVLYSVVQAMEYDANLTAPAARAILTAQMAVIDDLVASDPEAPSLRMIKIRALHEVGDLNLRMGDIAAAGDSYDAAQQFSDSLAAAAPGDARARLAVQVSLSKRADVAVRQSRFEDALRLLYQAEADLVAAPAEEADAPDRLVRLQRLLGTRGEVHGYLGDFDAARDDQAKAVEIATRLVDLDAERALFVREYVGSVAMYAQTMYAIATVTEIADSVERALELGEEALRRAPDDLRLRESLGIVWDAKSILASEAGDLAAAEAALDESLAQFRAISERRPADIRARRGVAVALQRLSDARLARDDGAGARQAIDESSAVVEALAADAGASVDYDRILLLNEGKRAVIEMRRGRCGRAMQALGAALERIDALGDAAPVAMKRSVIAQLLEVRTTCAG